MDFILPVQLRSAERPIHRGHVGGGALDQRFRAISRDLGTLPLGTFPVLDSINHFPYRSSMRLGIERFHDI